MTAAQRLTILRLLQAAEAKRQEFARYRDDPVGFIERVLGVRLWARQREIARGVARHKRVAVRSGHKVGKSTLLVGLALWWVCTRADGRVVMTSASARQVRAILWRELRKLYRGAQRAIGGTLHKVPEAGLQFDDGREVTGFSTKEPEKAAGVSGAELLYLIDEASGVPDEIFEAIEGNRAGGAHLVMFSNPTRTEGYYFDAFHRAAAFWLRFHVSSEETPNVASGRMDVPGLATREWVEEKREEWGEDSPLYQVRVRGNFPAQASNAVIGLGLVLDAVRRWKDARRDPEPADRLELGVDVARTGDDESVVYPRRGARAYPPRAFRGLDGPDLAGQVLLVAAELARPGEVPLVKIDANGVGASPYDALARSAAVETVAVVASEASALPDEYVNLRAELAFGLRGWLQGGGQLPDHGKTQADLVTVHFAFDGKNRLKVESKDEIKKRLKRSPDYGDALALAVYAPRDLGADDDLLPVRSRR